MESLETDVQDPFNNTCLIFVDHKFESEFLIEQNGNDDAMLGLRAIGLLLTGMYKLGQTNFTILLSLHIHY